MLLKQSSMYSVFLALLFSVLIHSGDIPYWTLGLSLGVLLWRYYAFRAGVGLPGVVVKASLVVSGFYGVFYSYGAHLSIEGMVTLLVAGVALKPLEVQKTSDSYLLVFLCFLLQGMHFLFDQSPLHYFIVLVCFVVTVFALVMVNQNDVMGGRKLKRSAGLAIKIFLLSLPLTIFLFFILPRLGPLWSLNISTKSGTVGLSESMSPGDLSSLGRNDELAFRVTFSGDVPAINERYWRALILDHYDGVEWSRRYQPEVNWKVSSIDEVGYEYQVTAEAHDKKWLFALANSSPSTNGVGVVENGTLVNRRKLISVAQYTVQSQKNGNWQYEELSPLARQAYLQYPKSLNKRAQALAKELAEDTVNALELILRFQSYFFSNPFSYTLSPGTLSSSSRVDEFLFDAKQGFCAHYAGAFVYMLRTLGIPSRVVVGYLGGEKNELADYYSIYQYDAHAWAEVWVEGKGWYRVDPTGWVSPERVEQGIEQAVLQEFAGFRSNSKFLRELRSQLQALDFYWQDWMLSYKGDRQQQLLDSLWGKRNPLELFFMISLGFAVTIGLVFLFLFWGSGEKKTRMQKLYAYWLNRLQALGIEATSGDSIETLTQKTINYNEQAAEDIQRLSAQVQVMLYGEVPFQLSFWQFLKLRRIVKQATK